MILQDTERHQHPELMYSSIFKNGSLKETEELVHLIRHQRNHTEEGEIGHGQTYSWTGVWDGWEMLWFSFSYWRLGANRLNNCSKICCNLILGGLGWFFLIAVKVFCLSRLRDPINLGKSFKKSSGLTTHQTACPTIVGTSWESLEWTYTKN